MASSGIFVRPPQVLFDPMIFFLYAVGLWGIVLTVLRIVVDRNVGKLPRISADVFSPSSASFS